jgi:hypothetical protein
MGHLAMNKSSVHSKYCGLSAQPDRRRYANQRFEFSKNYQSATKSASDDPPNFAQKKYLSQICASAWSDHWYPVCRFWQHTRPKAPFAGAA